MRCYANNVSGPFLDKNGNIDMDSITFISLIMSIEQYFYIELDMDKVSYTDINNIDNIVLAILSCMNTKSS